MKVGEQGVKYTKVDDNTVRIQGASPLYIELSRTELLTALALFTVGEERAAEEPTLTVSAQLLRRGWLLIGDRTVCESLCTAAKRGAVHERDEVLERLVSAYGEKVALVRCRPEDFVICEADRS